MWGMSRAQVNALVEGVTKGFEKKLEINGVGYKAALAGKILKLSLGYSHDVDYEIPAGITIVTPKPTEVVVSGIDKQKVGQVAAEIRKFRGPEPYKGKASNTRANSSSARKARRSKDRAPWRRTPLLCAARRASAGRSAWPPTAGRGSPCTGRISRSMPRSSTT
jgi:hypothetical protein